MEKVKVIFRKFKDNGEVIAFFPWIRTGNTGVFCLSYMHNGQHGDASYPHSKTVPCSPDEYAALKAELESIGYVLDVKSRYYVRSSKR